MSEPIEPRKAREFTLMWDEHYPARGWKFISYLPGNKSDDGKFIHLREVDPNRDALFNEVLEALKDARRMFQLILVEPIHPVETKHDYESLLERDKRDARYAISNLNSSISKAESSKSNE